MYRKPSSSGIFVSFYISLSLFFRRSKPSKKRRRVATVAQRRAANIRERRRMFNLNEAFDRLRNKVPTFAYEKRLSRIETLRLAITYISFMDELVEATAVGHGGSGGAGNSGGLPNGSVKLSSHSPSSMLDSAAAGAAAVPSGIHPQQYGGVYSPIPHHC